jgi:hypothetical protein
MTVNKGISEGSSLLQKGVKFITSGVKFFIVMGQIYCIGGLKLCLHPHS